MNWSFVHLQPQGTGFCRLSPVWGKRWDRGNRLQSGSSRLGQKTGLSQTFKHYQYSSPFFFVGKKDGKFQPVVDYRKLNSFTVPDRYPLPLIQELVDKVRDVWLFTKMDM